MPALTVFVVRGWNNWTGLSQTSDLGYEGWSQVHKTKWLRVGVRGGFLKGSPEALIGKGEGVGKGKNHR